MFSLSSIFFQHKKEMFAVLVKVQLFLPVLYYLGGFDLVLYVAVEKFNILILCTKKRICLILVSTSLICRFAVEQNYFGPFNGKEMQFIPRFNNAIVDV